MPRTARKSLGGVIYHVLNRGNGRQRLFHKPADYVAFVALLAQVKQAVPGVRLLAYCLMPNHWHLVLWPRSDGELSRFMQRLQTAHVRRHHAHYAAHASHAGAAGHLYQGRFKSFPVQRDDRHLLTVLRYVESNPLRADPPLARQPAGWNWCSFAARRAAAAGAVQPVSGSSAAAPAGPTGSRGSAPRDAMPLLDEWPVDVPRNWEALLREPLEDRQREALRQSLRRGRPFGDERWTAATAERLGLAHTLRPRGRPRKRKAGPAERTSDPLRAGAEKRGAKKRGGRKKGTFTFSERPPPYENVNVPFFSPFNLYVVAATKDTRNMGQRVYVNQAMAAWEWDGSQAIGVGFRWDPNLSKVTAPNAWSEEVTVENPKTDGPLGNDAIADDSLWNTNWTP